MEQSCSFLAPVFAAAIVQARSKAKRNLWNRIRVDSTKMPGHLQCAVLENIHTSITEVIGISFHKGYGGEGAVFKKILSLQEVWIFSGTSQYKLLHYNSI